MKKRVKIPVNNPAELLDLAKKVQFRHTVDGDASLLKVLKWTEITPTLEAAVAEHEKAKEMKRKMLEAYQQRNLKLKGVIDAMRDSRDILSGAYKKEMKVLGQWGYEVLDVCSSAVETKIQKVEASV